MEREYQLRTYRMKPDMMSEFVERWRDDLVPLRRAQGFEVLGAWTNTSENEFVWLIAAGDSRLSFVERETAYTASRAEIDFDPKRYIESVVGVRMVEPLDV